MTGHHRGLKGSLREGHRHAQSSRASEPTAYAMGKTTVFGKGVKKAKNIRPSPAYQSFKADKSHHVGAFPTFFLQLRLSSCRVFLYLNSNEYANSLKLISAACLGTTPSPVIYPIQKLCYFADASPDPTWHLPNPDFSTCAAARQSLLFLNASLSKLSTAGINNQLLLSFSSKATRSC